MNVLALVAAAALSAAPSQSQVQSKPQPPSHAKSKSKRQSPYRAVSLSAVARGDVEPGPVRVTGRYLAFRRGEREPSGVLASDRYALRVEGDLAGGAPRAGEVVELRGMLALDERGPVLRVGEERREDEAPHHHEPGRPPEPQRPAPQGPTTRLWLKVTQTGSNPLPMNSAVTEDGQPYTLPPSYAGPYGEWVCLEGTVGSLGGMRTLRDPKLCPPGTPRR